MKKFYLVILLFLTPLFVINAQNLVVNGDFETWDDATTPTSWTHIENASQDAVTINNGTYSCKHTGGTSDLGQLIPVTPGMNYQISVSYYLETGDGSDIRLWSYWKDNGTSLDENLAELRTDYFAADASWKTYTATITAPANASDLYLEVRTYSSAIAYWDDFTLVAVADLDAPVWSANYPMAANVDETSFDIASQLDETSTVYYTVLAAADAAPSVSEVMAGTGAAGAAVVAAGSFASGSPETLESVTGLTADTDYTVYLVAEDDESTPNVQAAVVSFDVTPTTPPDMIVNETFSSDLGSFTAVSVLGDQVWAQDSYNDDAYAKISGYSGGAQLNEDWLVIGPINLDASTDNILSFLSAWNYGGPTLELMVSSDFSGTLDPTSIAAATWTDMTSQAAWSAGNWDWTESGMIDLTTLSGEVYFAFKYTSNDVDGAGTWEVADFKITGFLIPGSDATLSDLSIDGTTIEGFDAASTSYTIEMAAGTTTIPTITFTTTDVASTTVLTDATDLAGDATTRTTTVEVTAQDGSTIITYTILFNPIIEVADIAGLRAATDLDRKYSVTGELVLTHKDSYRSKKYFEDATGAVEIDDNPGVITSVYDIGDGVTGLTGTLQLYSGFLQLHPTADPGVATSNGNAVDPQVLTITEFTTNFDAYPAEFVKIEGVSFTDAGTTFDDGGNYDVTIGDNSTVARAHFYGTLSGTIPNMADIQGIAIWHYDVAKVALRMQSDVMAYSSDATLSDLMVDATSVDAFDAATLTYAVELGVGTTTVPTVSFTVTDALATGTVTDATDLFGTEAERTTSVEVTAEDGTLVTYTIVFTVDNTSVDLNKVASISVYPVPAIDEIKVKGLGDTESFIIVNVLGSTVRSINVTGDEMSINISDLDAGIYMIRTTESVIRFMKK